VTSSHIVCMGGGAYLQSGESKYPIVFVREIACCVIFKFLHVVIISKKKLSISIKYCMIIVSLTFHAV